MTTPATALPEQLLDEVRRLREQARRQAHAGAWFPVAALAVLLLASISLYLVPFAQVDQLAVTSRWAGLPDEQRSAQASYLFWFIGTPLTITLIGVWYRWRARRVGVRVPWRWFAITALGALLALAVLAAMRADLPADHDLVKNYPGVPIVEQVRLGLFTPVMPIALAIVVLGWAERSRAVALSGVWVGAITWWQCSQGLGQLAGWQAWVLGGFEGPALGGQLTLFGLNRPGPTLILMALPLLVFATVRAVRSRGAMK
ncbi:hypothetical protein [Catellatospora coxensis]|uniref:Uncharacterized protein n=1 Tax=Catellatospora coxensis TaxID=310354 RepID=A0A8J3L617_9ACTN|nr:hypothetical protein [Catellatospora coxensis]GIG08515.1 hypothetical protein Cco03nite_52150 [Catellatospora coxensis]